MDFLAVFLDKQDAAPLYLQLYRRLVRDILGGQAKAGEKLPGKRSAAAQLGVSVNTVDQAYQMLAAEGYVEARPKSGFVVNRVRGGGLVPPGGYAAGAVGGAGEAVSPLGAPKSNSASARGAAPGAKAAPKPALEPAAETASAPAPYEYSFGSGGLDVSLFPLKTWNRLLREVLAGESGLFARGESGGDEVLRVAIADYLQGWRGVRCHAAQVVVGAGLEVLCGMLARLLAARPVALEDPGYPKTGLLFSNMGAQLRPVPVDRDGLIPEALEKSGAGAVYVTPSHQFPTGAVMPVGRRGALLEWARQSGGVLIEDDYDSEFRFDGRPLPSLQGLDTGGQVVYAGTFSRSLAPGLRAAYLVLPPRLLQKWQAAYGEYACTVSRQEQHTLARLMSEGHFARSLNRVRTVYRHRRDALLAILEQRFAAAGAEYETENTHTGLYFILRLPHRDAPGIARAARSGGLWLRALDEYRMAPAKNSKTADALVLGYGGLKDEELGPAVDKLLKMVEKR